MSDKSEDTVTVKATKTRKTIFTRATTDGTSTPREDGLNHLETELIVTVSPVTAEMRTSRKLDLATFGKFDFDQAVGLWQGQLHGLMGLVGRATTHDTVAHSGSLVHHEI